MTPANLPEGPVLTRGQAVYLMHVPALGYFKVGRSENPEKRVSQIQSGCPEKVDLLGASQIDPLGLSASEFEFSMHRALFPYRSHGEWFAKLTTEEVFAVWVRVWNDVVARSMTEPVAVISQSKVLESGAAVAQGIVNALVAGSNPASPAKRGRPLEKDRAKALAATKPWEAEGMSRTTWFRRQKAASK